MLEPLERFRQYVYFKLNKETNLGPYGREPFKRNTCNNACIDILIFYSGGVFETRLGILGLNEARTSCLDHLMHQQPFKLHKTNMRYSYPPIMRLYENTAGRYR